MLTFYALLFGVMRFGDESNKGTSVHQILCKSRKSVTETLAVIRQAFAKESMSCFAIIVEIEAESQHLHRTQLPGRV
jgi:hypothetical protein